MTIPQPARAPLHRRSSRRLVVVMASLIAFTLGFGLAAAMWLPGVGLAARNAASSPTAAAARICHEHTGDPGHVLGVSTGGGLNDWSEPLLWSWFSGMHHAHVDWIRADADAGSMDASGKVTGFPDREQRTITQAGICHRLLIIDGNAGTVARFAKFAGDVARHYPRVNYFQIGNEINYKSVYFYHGVTDPRIYLQYLKAARKAILHVNPDAFIVAGAMGPGATQHGNLAPADFMDRLYRAGGAPYFDAAAVNPYSFPVMPSFKAPWNSFQQMFDVHHVMVLHHDGGTKIWITEFGAPTHGTSPHAAPLGNPDAQIGQDHVTPKLQAAIVEQGIAIWARQSWTGPMFIYSWRDKSASPTSHEGSFGVLNYQGNPKPAFAPFYAAARRYG